MSPEFASFFTTHQPLLQNCQRPPRVIPASSWKKGGKVYIEIPLDLGAEIYPVCLRGCEGRPVYVDRGLSLVIMRGEGGGRKITFLPRRRRRKYAMPTTRTNERTNHSPGDLGGWKKKEEEVYVHPLSVLPQCWRNITSRSYSHARLCLPLGNDRSWKTIKTFFAIFSSTTYPPAR